MNEPRPLKVFLCHSSGDKPDVRELYHKLAAEGWIDPWLDEEKLLPGQDWELEIRKAIHATDVVLVCLSKQFNQAGFRQKEVRLALDTAMEMPDGVIFIIPARLDECDIPESLSKWHWVNLFKDDGWVKLMRALSIRTKKKERGDVAVSVRKASVDHGLQLRNSIKIMITGGRKPSPKVKELAHSVGYQAISRRHILMSNGTRGVDQLSAEGALKACKEGSLLAKDYIQVFRPKNGSIPDFNIGALHIIGNTYDQRRDYVIDQSDVVIILGGGHGTVDVAKTAWAVGKPLIPIGIGDPEDAAVFIWQNMVDGTKYEGPQIGRDDLRKIGHYQSIEKVSFNAIVLAENLVL